MEEKKKRPVNTTITRDTAMFSEGTGNIYETVAILSKRANQIATEMKKELHKKIEEFASGIDTMDEIYENREQIEVVRHYEMMPKPTLKATQEYLDGELYFRNPAKEDKNMQRLEAMENEAIAEGAVEQKKD
ncbi:MAG: DNA-directed RNA polymerase subunit omega [Bacteroidales bacterium]|nr:DNA-directed RNA polymerase subunit omega [Bacteroidales bacterium]